MLNKILCVDDDEVTLMICKVIISNSKVGAEMLKAVNGQIALDIFNNDPQAGLIDLVLLDINMPVKNGWDFLDEFTEKLQFRFPRLRVAILSSSMNPEDIKRAKNYFCVIDFISKPLTTESIASLKVNPALKEYFSSQE